MIIKDGKMYYPVELPSILSVNGKVIYDREIWAMRCPIEDWNRRKLIDCNGQQIILGRYAAYGITLFVSAYTGEKIDNFVQEVLS